MQATWKGLRWHVPGALPPRTPSSDSKGSRRRLEVQEAEEECVRLQKTLETAAVASSTMLHEITQRPPDQPDRQPLSARSVFSNYVRDALLTCGRIWISLISIPARYT